MADLTLPVQAGNLPSGFCPASYQDMLNGYVAVMSVILAQGTGIQVVASSTKPADTSVVWLQLDSLGRPVRFYYFASGAWLALHPMVPGTTIIWTQALPTFTSFDGGDANPLSPISGPMWEEVVALRARFPIGVGTLPSTAVVNVGDTGGQEQVTLDATNMPAHGHQLWVGASDGSTGGIREALQTVDSPHAGTAAQYRTNDGSNPNFVQNSYGDAGGLAVAHNNLVPYVGVYFLRRTSRLMYSVP